MELSESGSPIYRHRPRETGWQPPDMSDSAMDEISDHIEKHLGPIEMVFHEIIGDLVHLDVHHVAPTQERPWHTLVTSGMSDRPMNVPAEMGEFRHAELMIQLPPEWKLTQEDFKDERNYWPMRWLKQLARLPHEYNTWLGYGHTVPNGDPPEGFAANTKLCCMLVEFPLVVPDDFRILEIREGKRVCFWNLIPIYQEEMDLKMRKGAEALENLFEKNRIGEIIDPTRANVARKKFLGLF